MSLCHCVYLLTRDRIHDYYMYCALRLLPQAFTALAYGAKGILYFTYWPESSFHGAGMIIEVRKGNESNYVPGPHYFQVRLLTVAIGHWVHFLEHLGCSEL